MLQPTSIRGLANRVEPEIAQRLYIVREALLALKVDSRASRIYINEIADAIDCGLLLAAIDLATALVEIWVRDLLVIRKVTLVELKDKRKLSALISRIDKEIEGIERGQMFGSMCRELLALDVIDARELNWLEELYKRIRIPLHHGVSGRIVDTDNNGCDLLPDTASDVDLLFGLFSAKPPHRRADSFEDFLYSEVPGLLGDRRT